MSKTNDHKNSGEVNLFSILSHELKSSITLIQGLSELLKDNSLVGTNKELAQLVGYIHSTSNHTHKLLENVLNWSFLQNGNVSFKPQNVSVKEIVNHELEQLAFAIQHKELKLSCSVADEIIFADKHLLGMVIRNLLTNAIKYSYRGGAITLSLYIYLDFYEFTITDSGKGINDEVKRRLFKDELVESELGTESEQGTGLGLILCKEFVEQHHGKLWFTSEEGRGSQFKFIIPSEGFVI